jgi:transposase
MAARLALAGKTTTIPKQTDGIVESIRLLRVTRAGAVKARSAARKTIRGKATLCRRLRRQPHAAHDRRLPPALLPAHPAYAARRTKEGKTTREIIRCLKRYIARETYHALRADLADLTAPHTPAPHHPTSITCGAAFLGTHRRQIQRP